MFERRLLALGYPNYQNFNADGKYSDISLQTLQTNYEFSNCLLDQHEYRRLVLWLEEQRIRHYQVADRKVLRKLEGGDKWQEQFELYLKSLNCPYIGNHAQALSWLLGTALQVEEQGGINQKNLQQQDALKNIDGKKKEKKYPQKKLLLSDLFFSFQCKVLNILVKWTKYVKY